MKLSTTKLLPETKRNAKQQAAARGLFLYEYLAELVRRDITSVKIEAGSVEYSSYQNPKTGDFELIKSHHETP